MSQPKTKKQDLEKKDKRPAELPSTTYKIFVPTISSNFYITISDNIDANGARHPYELFIDGKNLSVLSLTVTIARLVSALFRIGTDPAFIVDELKKIYDPNGGWYMDGNYVHSFSAAVGEIIHRHCNKTSTVGGTKFITTEAQTTPSVTEINKPDPRELNLANLIMCPVCNERGATLRDNCISCIKCGYSKCG